MDILFMDICLLTCSFTTGIRGKRLKEEREQEGKRKKEIIKNKEQEKEKWISWPTDWSKEGELNSWFGSLFAF